MPWSGGSYVKGNNATGGWSGDESNGIGIEAGRHDTQDNDFAAGINSCLNKDGSNSCTGDLNFGGNKPVNIAAGTDAAPALCLGNDVDTGLFSAGANQIGLSVSGSEKMRINSSGLGINTTGPADFLHIVVANPDKGIILTGSGSGNRPAISFYNGVNFYNRVFSDNGGFSSGSADSLVCQSGGSGGVYLALTATAWAAVSDIRFKKNIAPLSYGLKEVRSIDAIRFDYKEDKSDSSARVGFSAQSILAVIPEAVTGSIDEKLGVAPDHLLPALVNAIKELAQRVEELEAKVNGCTACKGS